MSNTNNRNELLVPAAASKLDVFKYEIADELGYALRIKQPKTTPQNWNRVMDTMKYEIAQELGFTPHIKNGYWGELSSRSCGAVGGRMGGRIGGNMVRQMIRFAQENMAK